MSEPRPFKMIQAGLQYGKLERMLQDLTPRLLEHVKAGGLPHLDISIHATEAYEQVVRELEILRSKESQFESTVLATVKERDEIKANAGQLFTYGFDLGVKVYNLEAKLNIALEALKLGVDLQDQSKYEAMKKWHEFHVKAREAIAKIESK